MYLYYCILLRAVELELIQGLTLIPSLLPTLKMHEKLFGNFELLSKHYSHVCCFEKSCFHTFLTKREILIMSPPFFSSLSPLMGQPMGTVWHMAFYILTYFLQVVFFPLKKFVLYFFHYCLTPLIPLSPPPPKYF